TPAIPCRVMIGLVTDRPSLMWAAISSVAPCHSSTATKVGVVLVMLGAHVSKYWIGPGSYGKKDGSNAGYPFAHEAICEAVATRASGAWGLSCRTALVRSCCQSACLFGGISSQIATRYANPSLMSCAAYGFPTSFSS